MTEIKYGFGAIQALSTDLNTSSTTIETLLSEADGIVSGLASVWDGSAHGSYASMQAKWTATANEVKAALTDMSQRTANAATAMQSTESGNTGLFT